MTTTALDNKVKMVVSNIRNLPTPPIVFNQIQKVINDPHVSANDVASILAEDPAMSVKVLKLTNSAFYGLNREIEVVREAVVIVGMEAIKNLVLSASVLDMFKSNDIDQEFQEKFWRHSLATAVCCRLLVRRLRNCGIVDADAAFSAGLLHDVGKMVICCFLPNEYKKLTEFRKENSLLEDIDAENEALGYNHTGIGAFLAEQWKLPSKLRDAISSHHSPAESQEDGPMAYFVSVADYIAKLTFRDPDIETPTPQIDPTVLEHIGLEEGDMGVYSEHLREEYLKAETFMKMAGV